MQNNNFIVFFFIYNKIFTNFAQYISNIIFFFNYIAFLIIHK